MKLGAGKATLFRILGYGFFALGGIGAFVPLLPTTIFWIFAVWLLAKSDDPFAQTLLDHPKFGKGLRDWFDHGAISRRGKTFAVAGLMISYGILWWLKPVPMIALVSIGVLFFGIGGWLVCRPAPSD